MSFIKRLFSKFFKKKQKKEIDPIIAEFIKDVVK